MYSLSLSTVGVEPIAFHVPFLMELKCLSFFNAFTFTVILLHSNTAYRYLNFTPLPLNRQEPTPLGVTLKYSLNNLNVDMVKQKTSINIDPDLWKEWTLFVVKKTGSTRKLSEELEKAIKEYMQKHKNSS